MSETRERGEAAIRIELKEGALTVYHGESPHEILLYLPNVPPGTWRFLWAFLRAITHLDKTPK